MVVKHYCHWQQQKWLHSSSSSAQAIIQAWADLTDSFQHQAFHTHHLQALKILVGSQANLYVADPQPKLIFSILSSQSLLFHKNLIPYSLDFYILGLGRQTSLVDYAIEILLPLFSHQSHADKNSLFFCKGILLLGGLSFQTSASEKSKRLCLKLLYNLLEEGYGFIFLSDELASSALAGAGYALSSSVSTCFRRTFDILLSIWGQEGGSSGCISQPNSLFICRVMAAAGLLRDINRSGSSGFMHLKNFAEECIEIVPRDFFSITKVFVAFVSSGKDPSQNERVLLKEQLLFCYIQRSLEDSPFERMASGVTAIVRHLPVGSPAIFYCIHSLVEKATSLSSSVSNHDSDLGKNREGELEPSKKVLAQLIIQLPVSGLDMLRNQSYQQIAESDDVIEKLALVSRLQSLPYLSSQDTDKRKPELVGKTTLHEIAGSISLNRINERL
ncbi:UNVERIFIED_CONTAM: hypothetical protein Sindi_1313900 [Sesamum indicum]